MDSTILVPNKRRAVLTRARAADGGCDFAYVSRAPRNASASAGFIVLFALLLSSERISRNRTEFDKKKHTKTLKIDCGVSQDNDMGAVSCSVRKNKQL